MEAAVLTMDTRAKNLGRILVLVLVWFRVRALVQFPIGVGIRA